MSTLPVLMENYIKDTVGLQNVTNDAQLKRADSDWVEITEEPTPGSTDFLLLEKVTTGAKRKVQVGNLPTGGGGEANTGSNQGVGGVGLFHAKVGIDLQFKNINAGSKKVMVTDDPINKEVDIDVAPENIAHQSLSGAGINTHAQIDSHLASTSNPHSVNAAQVGAITDAADAIKDTHIDWGTGPGQVSADDIPDGSTKIIPTATQKTNWDTHVGAMGNPHCVTKTQVGLGNVTNDAQLKKAAGDINSFSEKTTPASADLILIEDSAEGYAKKKVRIANLPVGSGGSSTFTGLADTPDSYAGQEHKLIKVSATGDCLEFGYPDYIIPGIAGENLAPFELCFLHPDGKFWRACAGNEATMPGLVLAGSEMKADQSGTFIRRGQVTNGSWSWSAIGKYVYTCTTPGGLTQTLLSGSGEQVQIIGVALSATQIDFDPQLILIEVPGEES
jgi:hypothetical protein